MISFGKKLVVCQSFAAWLHQHVHLKQATEKRSSLATQHVFAVKKDAADSQCQQTFWSCVFPLAFRSFTYLFEEAWLKLSDAPLHSESSWLMTGWNHMVGNAPSLPCTSTGLGPSPGGFQQMKSKRDPKKTEQRVVATVVLHDTQYD